MPSPELMFPDEKESERIKLIEQKKREAEQRFYNNKITRNELDIIRAELELEELKL